MKCGLRNYWWEFPNGKVQCEGSIITEIEIQKMKSRRNGFGFWKVCDGDIEIEVRSYDEPYMGGSSATLGVGFRCNHCGNSYYPERNLPDEYNINEWLNAILKEIK